MQTHSVPTPRSRLVDAFRRVPPTAPTVCEGWQARHLAAHVVLRERAIARLGLSLAQGRDLAYERGEQIEDLVSYEALIDQVADGPGKTSPMEWIPAANVFEFEVHTLDVDRGSGLPDHPSHVPEPIAGQLWSSVRTMASLRFSRAASRGGVGVIFVVDDGPRAVIARGGSSVVVRGSVAELALMASGRSRVSLARLGGPESAVASFTEAIS